MKIKWLRRHNVCPYPYLTLCHDEDAFQEILRSLKSPEIPRWMGSPRANATTHYLRNANGELTCVVCTPRVKRPKEEIYGLLVHEAVHIVQEWFDDMGEHRPGSEQQAYAVQGVFQILMRAYENQS